MTTNPSAELYADLLAAFPTLPPDFALPHQADRVDFFPYGTGMCVQGAPFPVGGVMVLGHNGGSDVAYHQNPDKADVFWPKSVWVTYRNTYALMERCGIDPASCFFTNFYPGYVTKRDKDGKPFNVGAFPLARNTAFVRACREFLVRQLQVQRPRCLVVLGTEVPPLLAEIAPQFRAWSPWPGFAKLDAAGSCIVRDVVVGGHTLNACVVVHPSYAINARHRSFGGLRGEGAETAMVRSALPTEEIHWVEDMSTDDDNEAYVCRDDFDLTRMWQKYEKQLRDLRDNYEEYAALPDFRGARAAFAAMLKGDTNEIVLGRIAHYMASAYCEGRDAFKPNAPEDEDEELW